MSENPSTGLPTTELPCGASDCPSSSSISLDFPASNVIEAKRIDTTSGEGQRLVQELNCTELEAITESDHDGEGSEEEKEEAPQTIPEVVIQSNSRPSSASFLRPSSSQSRPTSSQSRPTSSSQRLVPSFSRPSSSSSSRPLSAASSLLMANSSLSHITSESIPLSTGQPVQQTPSASAPASSQESSLPWFYISESKQLPEGGRLHVRLNQRYVTLFRHRGRVTAIDAICHHAGGPLTLGPLEDIEELGVRVVLCPWHRFMVTIDEGVKAYQGVEIVNGKPVKSGWKLGKVVQRPYRIIEKNSQIYLLLVMDDTECMADKDACSQPCARDYKIYKETSNPLDPQEIKNLSLPSSPA